MASHPVTVFYYLLLLVYSESYCAIGGSVNVELCQHGARGSHTCNSTNSLDEALSMLSSDTTMCLSPGLHVLQNFSLIHSLRNIHISGNNTASSVTIECTTGAGLAFFNISGLVIENLDIRNCGRNDIEAILEIRDMLNQTVDAFFQIPNDTKLNLFLGACADVTMNRVTIANTSGPGLVGINVMGTFSLSEVSFENNSNIHPVCIMDLLTSLSDMYSLGKQIGGGAIILYQRFHATFLPQYTYVNLSITNTSFINNSDCSPNTFVELYSEFSMSIRDIGYIIGGGGGLTLMVAQCDYPIDVRVDDSTFQGNTARYGSGAHIGIFNDATNCHVLFTNCTFIGNGLSPNVSSAEQGGAGVAILDNLISPYSAQSRLPNKTKDVSINIEFCDFIENIAYAGAGVYVSSRYSTATVRNDSDATVVMCSYCCFRSNSATLGPALFADASKLFGGTPGIQIHLSNIAAVENIVAPLKNGSFRSVSNSSAVIDIYRLKLTMDTINITENRGTGLLGTRSVFIISGNINISSNTGDFGGGMRLITYTTIILQPNSTIVFKNNTGRVRGGALYVAHQNEPNFVYTDCFLYFQTLNIFICEPMNASTLEQTGISITFSGNNAPYGSIVYGSTLNTCCWAYSLRKQYTDFNGTTFELLNEKLNKVFHFDNITGVERITTSPNILVVNHSHSTTIPGQSIEIGVAAFDRFDQYAPTVITSTVLSASQNATSLVGRSGYHFLDLSPENNVTNISLIILGPEKQTVTVGLYSIDSFAGTQFTVYVSQCSPGFEYNLTNHTCTCREDLKQEGINCNTDTQTLEVPNHLWVGPVDAENDSDTVDLVHGCVLDYCQPGSKTVSPGEYDTQCEESYGRTGMLCGTCIPGYSTVFGTNRCLKCSNAYLALIIVFIVAGIILVLAISLLKITITNGFLNGILFYCNVISLYTRIFAPVGSTYVSFIVISFLNINLGVEVCFYDGMNALARAGLQLLFPAYLFLLMGGIVVLARSQYRCSKCFSSSRFNANEMFGTLLVLCYTSILESCVEILGVVRVQTLTRDTLIRWVVDPTVPYFHGWHGVLGAIAITLVLFYIILFPLVLLFPTYVYQHLPKLKPFFDALYNPFKKEFRFWLALRLMLRSIPLVLVFFVSFPLNIFILAIFLIVLLYIQLSAKPFQRTAVNVTDGLLLMNAIILTVGALFFDNAINTASEEEQSSILIEHTSFSNVIVYLAYAIFLGILVYYIYLRLPEQLQMTIKDKIKALPRCFQQENRKEEADLWSPEIEERTVTHSSVRISSLKRVHGMAPKLRIPLLDQTPAAMDDEQINDP